jgi:hypothetical protein
VQRHGPEPGAYEQPVLNGGFPLGFLYDSPGVPVEDRLAPGEDRFLPLPFLGDVVFYFGLLTLSWRMGAARRRRRAEARARTAKK